MKRRPFLCLGGIVNSEVNKDHKKSCVFDSSSHQYSVWLTACSTFLWNINQHTMVIFMQVNQKRDLQ